MFELFIDTYKEMRKDKGLDWGNNKNFAQLYREMSLARRIAFFISSCSLILILIVAFIDFGLPLHVELTIYLFCVSVSITLALIFSRKNKNDRLESNKKKIELIEGILKCKNFNLYSCQGINWLIDCCIEKLKYSIFEIGKRIFGVMLFPVPIILQYIIINAIEGTFYYEALYITVSISLIIGFAALFILVVISFISLFNNDFLYRDLASTLRYIKTQIDQK